MLKNGIYTAFVILLFIPAVLAAQNQKIGFFDSDIILQSMTEYSGIEQRLELLSENWQQEINELENEIDELERDFEAREILFTEEVREQRMNEITQKKRELDRLTEEKFGPDGEYFTTQSELLEPIQRSIFEALNSVAERESYDFVFDRAQETRFLFIRQQWNLTEEVMLELGLDVDSVSN